MVSALLVLPVTWAEQLTDAHILLANSTVVCVP